MLAFHVFCISCVYFFSISLLLEKGQQAEMTAVFNPLHEASEKELAETRLIHHTADEKLVGMGFPANDIFESTYAGEEPVYGHLDYDAKEFEKHQAEQDELRQKEIEDKNPIETKEISKK